MKRSKLKNLNKFLVNLFRFKVYKKNKHSIKFVKDQKESAYSIINWNFNQPGTKDLLEIFSFSLNIFHKFCRYTKISKWTVVNLIVY